eukprot:1953163-Prymnesium_polylepis.2
MPRADRRWQRTSPSPRLTAPREVGTAHKETARTRRFECRGAHIGADRRPSRPASATAYHDQKCYVHKVLRRRIRDWRARTKPRSMRARAVVTPVMPAPMTAILRISLGPCAESRLPAFSIIETKAGR